MILYFLEFEATNNCISSILNLDGFDSDSYIVVVDNASNNGSFERIVNKYSGIENIVLLANEKNLGFAQGNNRGYQYAREELGSDYIIIMNNDLCIKQKDFIQKTEKLLGRGFDVIGPDVVNTKTNKHQNPLAPANYRKLLEKSKSKLSSYLRPNGRFLFKVDCFKTSCKSIVKKLIKDSRGEFCSGNEYLEEQTTLPLHGSCIILVMISLKTNSIHLISIPFCTLKNIYYFNIARGMAIRCCIALNCMFFMMLMPLLIL